MRSRANVRWWRLSTAIRTSITMAACVESSTKPTSSPARCQCSRRKDFTEHAISENVIAGNAMSRRAVYMYGALMPRNAKGGVNGGLGMTTSSGESTLIVPSKYIQKTGETLTIDGITLVFQMTPGTEAPAEMNTCFPQFKAMWMAENSTNTHAQHPDPARRAGARRAGVVQVPERDHRPVWQGRAGQVPGASLAAVGSTTRSLPTGTSSADLYKYIARSVGEPHEQGLHRRRDLRDDQTAAGAGQILSGPRLLRHA